MINPMLEAELLAHLDDQIALRPAGCCGSCSTRARRSAPATSSGVLAKLAEIQTEMGRRGRLEQERTALLQGAGAAARRRPRTHVTLERLCVLITPEGARAARERSAELRGLLAEIAREHGINRALMRQELAFLSHLTRLVGDEPEGGYQPGGAPAGAGAAGRAPALHRTLDLQA